MLENVKAERLLLDLDEVCILDPQHAKIILLAFETSDYTAYLKMLKQNVRFHTAKRILLPLNTSGKSIAMESGSHWMLAELDLTSDEVAIYDWLTGLEIDDYNNLAGASVSGAPTCLLHACSFAIIA